MTEEAGLEVLSDTLSTLGGLVVAKAEELQQTGQLATIELPYIKPSVESFTYGDQGSTNHVVSYSSFQKKRWVMGPGLEQAIRDIPAHKSAVDQITRSFGMTAEGANRQLVSFVRSIAWRTLEPDFRISEVIDAFLNDLAGGPIIWEAKVWIDGLWLKEKRIELGEEMVLRQPDATDLENELPLYSLLGGSDEQRLWPAILQWSLLRRTEPEVTADITSFLDTLLLFRLGSIMSAEVELRPKSVLITGGKTTSGPQNVRYKYALTSVDVPDLIALFTKLKPLLQQIDSSTSSDAFSIGCRRFKEALLKGGTYEATITSGITCLEALLLGAGERQELKHRLGQRVSALASLLGVVYDPLAVYRDISFAYEIRSTFIHGSVVRGEKAKMLGRLCEAILNYSRLCLLVTVQLRGAVKKDMFLKTLDNSLLDHKQRAQLEQFLHSKVMLTM